MRTTQNCGYLLLFLATGFSADWSLAQSYPSRVIRIHTAGAGGSPDFAARILANELSAPLGQPLVVENRPAGITLGSGVAKAAPDGYTLLVWGGVFWVSTLFEEFPYDPIRDFAPIAMLTRAPLVLVVHPSLPVRSVADLIKIARARPGELNYSTGSTGAAAHITGELFKSIGKVDIVRVPYKGGAAETTDLLSGQIQMTFASGVSMAAHIKAGKMRALGVTSPQRSILFPGLPAVAESLPGCEMEQFVAFFAPGKTPDAVVRRLNQEAVRAFEKPEVRERLLANGVEPIGGTPEQLASQMKADIARVGKVTKDLGIKPRGE